MFKLNNSEYMLQKHISFQGKLLFKHTLNFMQSEISFLNNLISNWDKETEYDH